MWCQVIDEDKIAAHIEKWGKLPIRTGVYGYTPPTPDPPPPEATGEGGDAEKLAVAGMAVQEEAIDMSLLGTEGKLHAPTSHKDIAWRRLPVMVLKGSRYTTLMQDVLCFSFTTLALELGWDRIGPAQWQKKPRKIAAGKVHILGQETEP